MHTPFDSSAGRAEACRGAQQASVGCWFKSDCWFWLFLLWMEYVPSEAKLWPNYQRHLVLKVESFQHQKQTLNIQFFKTCTCKEHLKNFSGTKNWQSSHDSTGWCSFRAFFFFNWSFEVEFFLHVRIVKIEIKFCFTPNLFQHWKLFDCMRDTNPDLKFKVWVSCWKFLYEKFRLKTR